MGRGPGPHSVDDLGIVAGRCTPSWCSAHRQVHYACKGVSAKPGRCIVDVTCCTCVTPSAATWGRQKHQAVFRVLAWVRVCPQCTLQVTFTLVADNTRAASTYMEGCAVSGALAIECAKRYTRQFSPLQSCPIDAFAELFPAGFTAPSHIVSGTLLCARACMRMRRCVKRPGTAYVLVGMCAASCTRVVGLSGRGIGEQWSWQQSRCIHALWAWRLLLSKHGQTRGRKCGVYCGKHNLLCAPGCRILCQ